MAVVDESTHRKRMAQILRYIASMHHSLQDAESSFVRPSIANSSNFFQRENDDAEAGSRVLFSTDNFRQLLAMEQMDNALFPGQPFAFYAASASRPRKRMFGGSLKIAAQAAAPPERACWLRITRLTTAQVSTPSSSHPDVKRYLHDWLGDTSLQRLSQRRLEQAPKVPPTISVAGGQVIKTFLRKYKKYLRKKSYQLQLEPIYNRLFEWIQNQQNDELVWGLGHIRMQLDGVSVNGPVLEVQVEVELDRDGALLIRPREHTGVCLCREVVAAIGTDTAVLQQLHRLVTEMSPADMSPGQPVTYVPLLKDIAVQLSAGGSFRASSASISVSDDSRMVITESWCLFARSKPSSVWARDANFFADQLLLHPEFPLPGATWSLTHGPSSLESALVDSSSRKQEGLLNWISSIFMSQQNRLSIDSFRFPLPASDAQNRIAHLLLNKNYPAVVCEGPPGTGKSQTIANMICAYLCRGKRVLVTSKNAPALSVLRNRLPTTVQELCVDVSMSESTGMRQLQQTVERLANRVASVNSDMEKQKYLYLKSRIEEHEQELKTLDGKIEQKSESIRQLLKQPNGSKLIKLSIALIDEVPWLLKTIAKWSPEEVGALKDRIDSLVIPDDSSITDVSRFPKPPSEALISLVASKAGAKLSILSNAAKRTVAGIPIIGSLSGMDERTSQLEEHLSEIVVKGTSPKNESDWKIALEALRHSRDVHTFHEEIWSVYQKRDGWPKSFLKHNVKLKSFCVSLSKVLEMKLISFKMNVWDVMLQASECRVLDTKRSLLASRMQTLSEELVDATVVTQLATSFTAEAQSALIRFSQIAGKAKFSKSSQPSRMTQRQRRKRQEYLDAFDKCCRFIPCWVLTASQISDYLPAECLFDLVIIDESSQSDVTVIPGMLRGAQWLVVGDGKQVSPTESFVSEDQIDSLRAALPSCSLENSLLPGQSFFDLCAQAFPNGRVVLNEHFRCAPEIIGFSNQQFYDGQLVPLRLPLKSERISPSVLDVRVPDGAKVGKINEKEADEIVRRVYSIVSEVIDRAPRTIGIISLIGDEQSRLIRGRLLDVVGPHLIARHNILVGDPPAFQGAERDVVFLSMVCSRGSAPTQSQLMHFQRANVAMSRARDQIILVRSLEISDIPSNDDMKIPILEFFQTSGQETVQPDVFSLETEFPADQPIQQQLGKLLIREGYMIRTMGAIWKKAISVEHPESDMRAAIMIDCTEETREEWTSNYRQQKAIERVGWKSLRIDALSFVADVNGTLEYIMNFLCASGVDAPTKVYDDLEEDDDDLRDGDSEERSSEKEDTIKENDDQDLDDDEAEQNDPQMPDEGPIPNDADIVVVSSDEDGMDGKPKSMRKPEKLPSGLFDSDEDGVDAANFGSVVDLAFLRNDETNERATSFMDESSESSSAMQDDAPSKDTELPIEPEGTGKQRKRRRLARYARDGRWYPGRDRTDDDPDGQTNDWFDVDEKTENNPRDNGMNFGTA